MSKIEEIKKNVTDMFHFHRKESEKYKRILDLLDGGSDIPELSMKLDTSVTEFSFPDYPWNEPLIVKYIFLEGKIGRWWSKNQMRKLIRLIEVDKAVDTLKNDDQKIQYYVDKRKELQRIRYDSSKKYSFYSSQKDWIEETENGEYKIIESREPLPELLAGLTEEQKQKIEYTPHQEEE